MLNQSVFSEDEHNTTANKSMISENYNNNAAITAFSQRTIVQG